MRNIPDLLEKFRINAEEILGELPPQEQADLLQQFQTLAAREDNIRAELAALYTDALAVISAHSQLRELFGLSDADMQASAKSKINWLRKRRTIKTVFKTWWQF